MYTKLKTGRLIVCHNKQGYKKQLRDKSPPLHSIYGLYGLFQGRGKAIQSLLPEIQKYKRGKCL